MPIFMKLDNIKGDATATGHAGDIAVASLSYGISRPVSLDSGGFDAGRASVTEVTVTKANDRASVPLTRALLTDPLVGTVRIAFSAQVQEKMTDYLIIEMVGALVASVSASSDGERPFEQVSFTSRQMRWIDQTSGTQPVSFGYDLITARPV